MSSNFQIYEKVNDYDFLPENTQKFKEPREFTNVLFKRMSYHFEDGKGKINDFIIAQSFSKNNALINQNLNLKYHSQKMNLRQSVDKKDDEYQKLVRKKSTIEAEENWLAKQQNLQDSMAQYDYTIKNDCKTSLEKLEELKINQARILNQGLSKEIPFQDDAFSPWKGINNRKQEYLSSQQPSQIQQKANTFQVVVRSNSKDKTGRSSLNQSYITRNKSPNIPSFERQTEASQLKMRNNQQVEDFENIENAILSRPKSAFHNCQKLQRMYNTQQNRPQKLIQQNQSQDCQPKQPQRITQSKNESYVSERSSFLSIYNNTQETNPDIYNFTSQNIQNAKINLKKKKQNPEEVRPYQKHKFHQVCQKIQNINSLDHYMKMTQEEIDQLGKSVVSEEQKQQNTNERKIKRINKSNIEILKQQQHDQLLKIVDIFQDTKNSIQQKTIQKDTITNQNKSVLVSTSQSIYQNKSHSLTPNSQNRQIRNKSLNSQTYTPSRLKRKLIANQNNEAQDYSPFYVKDKLFDIHSPERKSSNQSPQSSDFSDRSQNQNLDQQKEKKANENDNEDFSQYIQNLEGTDIFMNANSEEQVNTKLKVLHLKQSYYKMKNTKTKDKSQIYFGKKTIEQGKISLGLEQKIKLFKYLDDDDDIKIHFQKPKKYVRKQIVVSNKQKQKEKSFVESVRDQENQLGVQSLKVKYGKHITKLYDFLKKCIRLKVCVDDIIEKQVFTQAPYERPGSYVFFKMVKQNQFEYVKNQIKECRWKVFDFDHMLMTPLHIAIIKGYKDMACYLIDELSDLEAEDIDNKTPLWYALKTKQYDIAKVKINQKIRLFKKQIIQLKYLLLNHAIPWANDNFKYYDIIDDIDMRTSLKVARQVFFLMSCTAYKVRETLWEQIKNRILDPLVEEQL